MKSTSDRPAGFSHTPSPRLGDNPTASSPALTPRRATGGASLKRLWLYRRIMRSSLVEPFRKVLRPLVRWIWQPHFAVRDEAHDLVPVNLKPPGTFTIVMSVIFAPLIFLMLLPLLLILVPVVMIVALAALLVPALTGEMDGGGRRPTFASH